MTIPQYQEIMLPLLKFTNTHSGEISVKNATQAMIDYFKLNQEEQNRMIPSGSQTYIRGRVGWARTYLAKAKLLDVTKRGFFQISERGKELLKTNITKIDINLLQTYSEFVEFKNKKNISTKEEISEELPLETPEEEIQTSYNKIRAQLSEELLQSIADSSPAFFERLVVQLLVAMGYGGSFDDAAQATKMSGDEGIDGIIKEDKLGLDIIYIQAKRWAGVVGRPEIQKFVGALSGKKANKGVFITTSGFTSDAISYALSTDKKIILIDGTQLAEYMIDYDIGVSLVKKYEIKKIDSDYFEV